MKIPRAVLCAPRLNQRAEPRSLGWWFSFRLRAKTGVGFAGQPKLQTRSGSAGVLVYLFRDENSRDTFAYSTDVTGPKHCALTTARKIEFRGSRKI
jgi:hypothetical protein